MEEVFLLHFDSRDGELYKKLVELLNESGYQINQLTNEKIEQASIHFNGVEIVPEKYQVFSEEIYPVMVQGNIIGTGSIRKNEICRLFVLPEYQGKGYGSRLMDLLEAKIFENDPKVYVDASFPAESMYLKRGYRITWYEKIETENGDFLCYHTMEKEMCRNLSV